MDARQEIADGGPRLGRRSVGLPGGVGDAAHRLDGDVHGGKIAIGSVEPEARAAAIDQAWVDIAQHLPAEPEAIHDAGGEILDHDVGLGDQREEDLLAAWLLEIEHHRLLVGVQHDQRIRLDVALAPAHDVAFRRLDLEHAGAHECELQAAIGAVVDLPEIEHEHPVERSANGHQGLLLNSFPSPVFGGGVAVIRGGGGKPQSNCRQVAGGRHQEGRFHFQIMTSC